MKDPLPKPLIVLADASTNVLSLMSEVLRQSGIDQIQYALDGEELLSVTEEFAPDMVITTSRLPKISGLEFTRMVRRGTGAIRRDTAIVAMTNTATRAFIEHARDSGVDEMLVLPFSTRALTERSLAALRKKRSFVDCASYIGPCRRRRELDEFEGVKRRFIDPVDEAGCVALWEQASHREAVRQCVQKISECAKGLSTRDRRMLRETYAAVKAAEAQADSSLDEMMGRAARSLGRYIVAIGANGVLDEETVRTHIDAMHSLGVLNSTHQDQREQLVVGLTRIVDKKLGLVALDA